MWFHFLVISRAISVVNYTFIVSLWDSDDIKLQSDNFCLTLLITADNLKKIYNGTLNKKFCWNSQLPKISHGD